MTYQRFESQFHFRCPVCGDSDILNLPVPEFNFNVERMSDLYSEDQVEFSCPSCDYEFSGDVVCTSYSCEISILEPTEFTISGDPPMFNTDAEAAYEPPPNPYALFVETTDRCLIVAELDFDAKNDLQFLKRMAFTTIVTALETYLADTLLNKLRDDQTALTSLILNDRHFAGMRIGLPDLVGKPDFASQHVRSAIQEIPFHNLPRADSLYKSATGFSLRFNNDIWTRLNADMRVRHDCVHRNGHDSEGVRRDDITLEFVRRVASDCQTLASTIEDQVNPCPF